MIRIRSLINPACNYCRLWLPGGHLRPGLPLVCRFPSGNSRRSIAVCNCCTACGGSPTVREGVDSAPSLTVGLPPHAANIANQIEDRFSGACYRNECAVAQFFYLPESLAGRDVGKEQSHWAIRRFAAAWSRGEAILRCGNHA